MRIEVYDSTLRDGAQAEGISYSLEDKLLIARRLDALGVDYIEGGWPNPTNPKDLAFFQEVKKLGLKARVTAFGSTRRAGVAPEEDATLNTLLRAETDSVCIFGKSWTLHVVEALKTTLEENLKLIEDSVAYLVAHGREVAHSEISPPPRPPSPLTRVIAHSMELMTNKGWMSSQDSSVSLNILPNWIGQIALSGIETERVSQWTLVV